MLRLQVSATMPVFSFCISEHPMMWTVGDGLYRRSLDHSLLICLNHVFWFLFPRPGASSLLFIIAVYMHVDKAPLYGGVLLYPSRQYVWPIPVVADSATVSICVHLAVSDVCQPVPCVKWISLSFDRCCQVAFPKGLCQFTPLHRRCQRPFSSCNIGECSPLVGFLPIS